MKVIFKKRLILFAVVVIPIGFLIFQFVPPTYEGKSAEAWFRQALEDDKLSAQAGEFSQVQKDWMPYVTAFRAMGDRGFRQLINEYIQETPFYLKLYDKTAESVDHIIDLPDRNIRSTINEERVARLLLLRIGSHTVPELIRTSKSYSAEKRAKAASLLGELGPENPAAKNRLLEMLVDRSDIVIIAALEVLWMTLPEQDRAINMAIPFLSHTNRLVRIEASYAIGRIGSNPPNPRLMLEPLLGALSDPDSIVRANAASGTGLAGIDSDKVFDNLENLLSDPQTLVRFRAAEALARLFGKEALSRNDLMVEVLAEAKLNSIPYYRLMGLNAEMFLGNGDAVKKLLQTTCFELLKRDDTYFRSEAIESLSLLIATSDGPFGSELRSMLEVSQNDPNGLIRGMAANALEMLDAGSDHPVR